MYSKLLVVASMLTACVAASAQAVDPVKLAQQKACLACHTVDKKMVGPSYKEVAAKYAGKKDAVNQLVTKVMKGGSGVWGTMPMPPQAVSEAEARVLVEWVLKQR
jgi:cytochrome c